MLDPQETIAAIASAAGGAARGVIRVSGPDALPLIAKFIPEVRSELPLRGATCIDAQLELGFPLGPIAVRLLVWPDERCYTGQPSAELHLTGIPAVLQETLDRLVAHGARLAEPGEFTLRSFLAGRIDLMQAEAVLGVIDAGQQTGLSAALDQLTGGISRPLDQLREELLHLLADVEAALDFVDEDIQFITDEELARRLEVISATIAATADRMHHHGRTSEMPLVVICGAANAGKSSLLNRISGRPSAMVSATVGTTRDPVEVRIDHPRVPFRLVDTAGYEALVSEAAGPGDGLSISRQAQQLGQAMIDQANLRLHCHDWSTSPATRMREPRRPLEDLGNRPGHASEDQQSHAVTGSTQKDANDCHVATKSDLLASVTRRQLEADGWLAVSSRTGEGISALIDQIIGQLEADAEPSVVAATADRCRETLVHATEGLRAATETVRIGGGHELVAAEMRLAIEAVGHVTGAVYTEEILDSIFSRFCIGK